MGGFGEELWHFLLTGGAGISIILLAYSRIKALFDGLKESNIEETRRRDRIEFSLSDLEHRIDSLEKKDEATMAQLQLIINSINDMRNEQTKQHGEVREYVHSEIRRLEDKLEKQTGKIFSCMTDKD